MKHAEEITLHSAAANFFLNKMFYKPNCAFSSANVPAYDERSFSGRRHGDGRSGLLNWAPTSCRLLNDSVWLTAGQIDPCFVPSPPDVVLTLLIWWGDTCIFKGVLVLVICIILLFIRFTWWSLLLLLLSFFIQLNSQICDRSSS